ncbi:Molybdenum cofactor sulfurase [Diplodia seriata]|uniref:Molybdenum cofactor sulfurase n=1 Tax=Diplodia seriata TaxID=420778 RepID=A0A1S8BGI6_9PEZI|nr:Molybdenum cofactor sulfurase [Diplodia seriata]
MKLVMDCFKDHCNATQRLPRSQRRRFWYGYHLDAHNSVVGIRETADGGQHCFGSDQEVQSWIHGGSNSSKKQKRKQLRLFAYPGQSNMTGRRLPLSWPAQIRASPHTSDPFPSILTLAAALSAHARLYTSMRHIRAHTSTLTTYLHASLAALRHPSTNSPLLTIYDDDDDTTAYGSDPARQGPMLAFNVLAPDGATVVPPARVERAADAAGVFVRSGSLCNPGGAARLLGWSAAELRRLHERDGLRCGGGEETAEEEAVTGGRPTGVVRVSLGASSVRADVDALVGFLREWAKDAEADADGGGDGEVAVGLAGGGGGRGGGVGAGISGGSSAEVDGVEGEKIRKEGKKRVLSLFSACYRGGKAEVSGKK